MQHLSKWRLAALPVGALLAGLMLIASEVFSVPILVPLSFLPLIVGLVYLAPFLAIGAGWCYEKLFGGGIQGTLISSSLRYRSMSIGLSVVLLFCICSVSTVTVGLANAGLGQVSAGRSYWKPGIHWGVLRDGASIEDNYREFIQPGVMGTFGQGRLIQENRRSVNAFVMSCQDYAALATDEFQCPPNDVEALLVPMEMDPSLLSNQFYDPITDSELQVPSLEIQRVAGLTEVLISTADEEINSAGRYVYADLGGLPVDVVLSVVNQTQTGFTSQERIDDVNSATSSGYREAAIALVVSILFFGLAAVSGIVIAAIRDRAKLFEAFTIRGVQSSIAKKLIRIETTNLTVPFVVLGCISGTVLAAAIAQVSSLDPRDAITSQVLWILAIYVFAVPLITEIQLRRGGETSD